VAIPKALKQEICDEAERAAYVAPRLLGELPDLTPQHFPKSKAIYDCTAERMYAMSGRRFCKTATFTRKSSSLCIAREGANVIYTARSLRNAKKIIFPELRVLRDRYKIPIRFRRSNDDVSAIFPGDSEIMFMGIKSYDRIEDLKGYGKDVDLVCHDELGTYPEDWVEEMVEDGGYPLTADCGGQLWLLGNPGRIMSGWWYEQTRLEYAHDYPVFRGTGLDNPYLQNALEEGMFVDGVNLKFQAWLRRYREHNNISENDPGYRRKWLGEWVQDTDALMFDYDPVRNAVNSLPGLPGVPLDTVGLSGPDWSGLDA
jgi:hypothetical protein